MLGLAVTLLAKAIAGAYVPPPSSSKTFSVTLSGITGATPASLSAVVSILNGTSSSSITPSITTNRTTDSNTGVAPFGVQFDATGTTCVGVSNPFRDLHYSWNFGDDDSATWSYGTRPGLAKRNRASGGVAAHVFESPGTFNVKCKITNPLTNDSVTRSLTITVTDPDVVFAGASTICIDKTLPVAGLDGVPAGAQCFAATTWLDVISIINSNAASRILIRSGTTWANNNNGTINVNGPGIISTYGVGAAPIITHSAASRIAFSATSSGFQDWRISGFVSNATALATGSARSATRFFGATDGPSNNSGRYCLLMDNEHYDAATFALMGSDMIVADCNIHNVDGAGGNVGLWCYQRERLAVLGSQVNDASLVEMNLRFQGVKKAVISNCKLKDPMANATKHALALRGWSNAAASYAWTGDYTEYCVISDNEISGASASGLVQIASQNVTSDERHRHIVVERNYIKCLTNYGAGLISSSSTLEIRNNLFEQVGGPEYAIRLQNSPMGAPTIVDVNVYNNTLYSASTVGHAGSFMWLESAAATGINIKNNVAYLPAYSGLKKMLVFAVGASYTSSNNTPDANIGSVSPQFLTTPPSTYADWRTGAASYASGGGIDIPVYDDFFATRRGTANSMGGVSSYGSSMVASTADVSVKRADGSVEVEYRLTNAAQSAVTGTINTADITAIAGVDYTAQTGVAFSIPEGSASGTITIPLVP